ncbi:MAG: SCO family protein [Planctomycetota bacterium]
MSGRITMGLAFLIVVSVLAAGLWGPVGPRGSRSLTALPMLKEIPDFKLTECHNRPVSRSDLAGHVWLANFVFTRCSGPCPELTLRMRSLQQGLQDRNLDAKLVTFSLDPEHDSPDEFRKYAERFQADSNRWWFLTGASERDMHRLVKEGFLQAIAPGSVDEQLTHSTYFVLVDRQGRMRAFYEGQKAESKPRILEDIQTLLGEPQTP